MAIIAQDQQTVLDVTDAYSVMLTNESHGFTGGETAALPGSTTTQVIAMLGAEQIAANIVLTDVEKPSGVTVTKDTDPTSPTLTIAVDGSVTGPGVVKIPVQIDAGSYGTITIIKEFSFSISFKGPKGDTGAAATHAILGNESVSVPATDEGLVSALTTVTIPFAGYQGTTRKACTASVGSLPSGMTLKTNTPATTSADGALVFEFAASATLGGAAVLSGMVTVTLTANSTAFTKSLAWSKSITGAPGGKGDTGTAATNAFLGNEAVSIAAGTDGKVSADTNVTIPFAGYLGTARIAATAVVGTLPSGVSVVSNSGATASADGSVVLKFAANATLGGAGNGSIPITVTANSIAFSKSLAWSKSVKGAQGMKGDDAITLKMESSNGWIFKNEAIAAVFTAHVYRGGVELTAAQIATIGTVLWLKDGVETGDTGTTLTVDAGDVVKIATYKAALDDGN